MIIHVSSNLGGFLCILCFVYGCICLGFWGCHFEILHGPAFSRTTPHPPPPLPLRSWIEFLDPPLVSHKSVASTRDGMRSLKPVICQNTKIFAVDPLWLMSLLTLALLYLKPCKNGQRTPYSPHTPTHTIQLHNASDSHAPILYYARHSRNGIVLRQINDIFMFRRSASPKSAHSGSAHRKLPSFIKQRHSSDTVPLPSQPSESGKSCAHFLSRHPKVM